MTCTQDVLVAGRPVPTRQGDPMTNCAPGALASLLVLALSCTTGCGVAGGLMAVSDAGLKPALSSELLLHWRHTEGWFGIDLIVSGGGSMEDTTIGEATVSYGGVKCYYYVPFRRDAAEADGLSWRIGLGFVRNSVSHTMYTIRDDPAFVITHGGVEWLWHDLVGVSAGLDLMWGGPVAVSGGGRIDLSCVVVLAVGITLTIE